MTNTHVLSFVERGSYTVQVEMGLLQRRSLENILPESRMAAVDQVRVRLEALCMQVIIASAMRCIR